MEVKGKLEHKFEEVQISEKFKKREFVLLIAENPEYPEHVKFELIQDKCNLLDGLEAYAEITVHFNLKGREWTDNSGGAKYFTSLQAWKIEAVKAESVQNEVSEDLPF